MKNLLEVLIDIWPIVVIFVSGIVYLLFSKDKKKNKNNKNKTKN